MTISRGKALAWMLRIDKTSPQDLSNITAIPLEVIESMLADTHEYKASEATSFHRELGGSFAFWMGTEIWLDIEHPCPPDAIANSQDTKST